MSIEKFIEMSQQCLDQEDLMYLLRDPEWIIEHSLYMDNRENQCFCSLNGKILKLSRRLFEALYLLAKEPNKSHYIDEYSYDNERQIIRRILKVFRNEGLAKQIENLGDDEVSNNLKVKLLYNIVNMSSENPGSLIKGYNKSDHPFIDIIDKSTNLTNALEKLSHLPGIKNIATSLLGKVETHQEEKIQKVLEVNRFLFEDE